MQFAYVSVSTNTIRSNCLKILYDLKINLISRFSNLNGVLCFSFVLWIVASIKSYIVLLHILLILIRLCLTNYCLSFVWIPSSC